MIKEKLIKLSALIFAAASVIFFLSGFVLIRYEFNKALRIGKAVGSYVSGNAEDYINDFSANGENSYSGIVYGGLQADQYNDQTTMNGYVPPDMNNKVSEDINIRINWFIVSAAGILFIMSIIMLCKFINQIYIHIRNAYIRYHMDHPYIR